MWVVFRNIITHWYIPTFFILINSSGSSVIFLYVTYQAKFSGHFVALVPLIVFCIVCIVGAFPTRVAKDKEFEESDEPMRLQRWKNVLSDNGELDILHSESRLDYNVSTLISFCFINMGGHFVVSIGVARFFLFWQLQEPCVSTKLESWMIRTVKFRTQNLEIDSVL